MREIRVLPRERYPLLVTFTDLADPTTVRRVDPDDLAATFGPGVALKRVTLEITDEAVTEGEVEAVLGADFFRRWAKVHRYALDAEGLGHPYFATFASDLNRGDFVRE